MPRRKRTIAFNNAQIPYPFGIDTHNIADVQTAARIGATNTRQYHMRKRAFSRKTRKQNRQICCKFKQTNAENYSKTAIIGQFDNFALTNIFLNKRLTFGEDSKEFRV